VEETDPAQLLPGRRQVVDTGAPGSVGPAPMLSPMGMPMSPHPQGPATPHESLLRDDQVLSTDLPAQEFGSPAVQLPQGHLVADAPPASQLFQPAELAEPAMPQGELLQQATQGVPMEPRILPAAVAPGHQPVADDVPREDCCSCCGNSHDGQENRHVGRGESDEHEDRDHRDNDHHGHGRHDHHGEANDPPPSQHAVHDGNADGDVPEGEVTDPVPSKDGPATHDPCACCGERHPGLDSPTGDGKPGEPSLPRTAPLTPTQSTPKGYAVAQQAPTEPAVPRGTMAPPVSERLAPLSPSGGTPTTPGQEPAAVRSAAAPMTAGVRVPGNTITPQQSALVPATPGVPATPTEEQPQLLSRVLAPMAPATVSTPPATTTPPTTTTPPAATPPPAADQPTYEEARRQPAETAQPRQLAQGTPTNQPGGAYSFSGMPGAGTGGAPPDGNVGPDPNIKFDEAQYLQLIGVIAEVNRTLDDATSIDVTYLDAELHLQPTGQTWEPAVNLVTRGGRFGGSVDTESTNLAKTLSTFHTALEQAKEVFKETDDLAAYDATRFSSEYPGFNSGGLPGAV